MAEDPKNGAYSELFAGLGPIRREDAKRHWGKFGRHFYNLPVIHHFYRFLFLSL
jgi:hypothetical protein